MQHRQAYTVEFFATLANIPQLKNSLEAVWDLLHSSLQCLLPETVEKLVQRIQDEYPQTRARSPQAQGFFAGLKDEAVTNLLHAVHSHTRRCILGLLRGDTVSLPFAVEPLGKIDRRRMKVTLQTNKEDMLYAELLAVLQMRPFPFGQCSQCGQIFVQARRGKPPSFCSYRCKVKAAPSRTAYKRQWQQQQRTAEISAAQRVLRKVSSAQKRLEHLSKEFPEKSRRQLFHLLKKAKQTTQEVSQHGCLQ